MLILDTSNLVSRYSSQVDALSYELTFEFTVPFEELSQALASDNAEHQSADFIASTVLH